MKGTGQCGSGCPFRQGTVKANRLTPSPCSCMALFLSYDDYRSSPLYRCGLQPRTTLPHATRSWRSLACSTVASP